MTANCGIEDRHPNQKKEVLRLDENNVGRTERPERPARSRKKRRGGAGRTVAKVIGTLVLMGITT